MRVHTFSYVYWPFGFSLCSVVVSVFGIFIVWFAFFLLVCKGFKYSGPGLSAGQPGTSYLLPSGSVLLCRVPSGEYTVLMDIVRLL